MHESENLTISEPITEEEKAILENVSFSKIIGLLIYLANGTRPDIAFAVHRLACYMHHPRLIRWYALQKLLSYLKTAPSYALKFDSETTNFNLHAYSYANRWGGIEGAHSTSGCVIMLGKSLVSWSAKKQTTVALSSTEAEYVTMTHCSGEIVWIKQLCQ